MAKFFDGYLTENDEFLIYFGDTLLVTIKLEKDLIFNTDPTINEDCKAQYCNALFEKTLEVINANNPENLPNTDGQ